MNQPPKHAIAKWHGREKKQLLEHSGLMGTLECCKECSWRSLQHSGAPWAVVVAGPEAFCLNKNTKRFFYPRSFFLTPEALRVRHRRNVASARRRQKLASVRRPRSLRRKTMMMESVKRMGRPPRIFRECWIELQLKVFSS